MWRAESFEKTLMLENIEGRRRRGWQRMRWLDGITRLNGHGFGWIPGVGDGQGGLVCGGSWACKESDTTEWLHRIEPPTAPLFWSSSGQNSSKDEESVGRELLSHNQHFATLWTVGSQVLLSMEFSREEYWSGVPFLTPWSSQPRDQTQVSCISSIGRWNLYHLGAWGVYTCSLQLLQFFSKQAFNSSNPLLTRSVVSSLSQSLGTSSYFTCPISNISQSWLCFSS